MPKKKKTQLKPVARGFATTSVPKKVELAAAEASDEEHDGNTVSVPHIAVDEHKQGLAANAPPASTPEDRFESEWTAKHQERTEREILRLLKALEVDRRFSKTFTSLDLDSDLEDEIIELAKQDYSLDEIDEPEEKALLSLGVTYGILRRIGVPQAVAEDCLAQMNGIDLDDAAVWLCMNRPELDIGPLLDAPQISSRTFWSPYAAEIRLDASPPVPDTTVQGAASHSNSPKMGAHSSPSLILPITDSNPDDNSDLDLMPDSQREQSTASAFWRAGSDSDTGSENDDDLDPNQQYAQLKLRIHAADISQKRRVRADLDSRVDSDLRTMRARLEKIKQNYLFREKEAEALFRAEKTKTDAAARTARLRGSTPQTSSPPSRPTKGSKSDVPQSAKLAAVDLVTALDGVDDDLFGAMLDTPATDSLTPVNISIASRNMALPKHWTGKVPRIHLQDAVTQMDKFASLAVEQVGGPSRLSKAGCTIRWSDGKVSHWEMTDVGCEDETQAIHFISIVALHALSCEVVPGFAPVGGSSSGRAFSFVRLLPNSFRSLWDELENHRKVQEEIQNSAVWCTLRALYMAKTSTNIPLSATRNAKTVAQQGANKARHKPSGGTRTSEQVQQDWLARTLRPEYVAMQDHRTRLPIAQHRDEILRLMEANAVVVLSGETGCGKSSQLPQFILQRELEQGRNCNIICTEPRRISAISLAQRVSQELGDPPSAVGTASSLVGYSIRLESNTSRSTRLTYMTNGIALRMLEQGSGSNDKSGSFDDVTHVIIDEVHERSIDSDFLLIILRSLLPRRPDLRVILMSATLDADKISAYFNNCPTIHVPGRTFPVEACYLEDAVELCKWNVPEGSPYAKDVRDPRYKVKDTSDAVLMVAEEDDEHMDASGASLDASYSRTTLDTMSRIDEKIIPVDLIIMLLEVLCWKSPAHAIFSSAVLVFMPGIAEIRQLMDSLSEHAAFGNSSRFLVMPLHSTLSSQEQSDVFNIPPFGVRKIVISTNIAETGVTIPDVTCVIDTGKHREMRYDEKRQISRLVDTFITKSNAKQRRGRAGRVQEGLCFHLFSKQRHETQMPENPQPEMLRLSLAGLALRIKITNITLGATIEDVFLSALDPPTQINIQRAIASLVEVGALSNKETITPLGLLLSKLPIDVHLGKLLAVATTLGCLDMALTIAATISNGKSPFVSPFGHEQEAANAKRSFNLENNDFLTMHQVYSSWRQACGNSGFAHKFTRQNFLSHQTLHQIEELRQHLLRYLVDSSLVEADRELVSVLNRSRGGRGRVQFIAVPAAADRNGGQVSIQQAAIVAGLWPKVITLNRDDDKVRMRTLINNQAVAFHPTSVNFHRPLSDFAASNFLVYFTIMQSKRLYAWETGAAQDVSIVLLCGEGEFRSSTETFALDRNKVRFRAKGRTGVAIQHVRQRIAAIFATRMRGQPVTDLQSLRWLELALAMLRRKRAEDPQLIGISR